MTKPTLFTNCFVSFVLKLRWEIYYHLAFTSEYNFSWNTFARTWNILDVWRSLTPSSPLKNFLKQQSLTQMSCKQREYNSKASLSKTNRWFLTSILRSSSCTLYLSVTNFMAVEEGWSEMDADNIWNFTMYRTSGDGFLNTSLACTYFKWHNHRYDLL